jgi:FixJ family two-component response regulator
VLLTAIEQALERSRTALAFDSEMRLPPASSPIAQPSRAGGVLALVVSGLLNKQAGLSSAFGDHVKAYRGQVMRKMQATSSPIW